MDTLANINIAYHGYETLILCLMEYRHKRIVNHGNTKQILCTMQDTTRKYSAKLDSIGNLILTGPRRAPMQLVNIYINLKHVVYYSSCAGRTHVISEFTILIR